MGRRKSKDTDTVGEIGKIEHYPKSFPSFGMTGQDDTISCMFVRVRCG